MIYIFHANVRIELKTLKEAKILLFMIKHDYDVRY